MSSLRNRLGAAVLLVGLLLSSGSAIAQKNRRAPAYKIEALVSLSAEEFRINDLGMIAASLGPNAVRVTSVGIETLWPGRADDINAAGDVVGQSNGQAM